jgi:hypothetical protein
VVSQEKEKKMLDDFRQDADAAAFEDESAFKLPPRPKRNFLGMTPFQRFVIAFMLLLIVCVLSSFALLVTEKVVISGL